MRNLWLLCLLTGCVTGALTIPIENGSINALFCDQIDCENELIRLLNNSQKSCAMYHPTEEIALIIGQKNLIVDESHPFKGAYIESGSGLMHNKFCVINKSLVWTGSWNPSQKMSIPNNVVLVESKVLAAAFKDEFNEMRKGVFHGGEKGSAKTLLNGSLIEVYFCPEDNCKEAVINILENSKSSIDVMAFSFTDDDIGSLLLKKSKEGVDVRAIFDPRKDKYSEYEKLKVFSKIKKVHHKVFIVDNQTVITGSYNPTKNGDERNDENVVIIHNKNSALQFAGEFNKIWSAN
jgi:phosphatidylserine/phosphatidylglycerophosphate/cardiolipin synthase-like enzyme